MRTPRVTLVIALLAAPASAAVAPAAAQPVTYTFTVTGTGTLGTSPFTRQTVTFEAAGDLSGVTGPGVNPALYVGIPLSLDVPGLGSFAVSSPVYIFNNSRPPFGYGAAGFGIATDFFQVLSPALIGYDLRTDIGPVPATTVCPDPFGTLLPCIGGQMVVGAALPTTGGDLSFSSITEATFTARLVAAPEPSAVALLGGGVVALGAAARRRRVRTGRATADA